MKIKATESVMSAKGLPLEQALASVEKVFPKCYADLEPFGLVPRRNSRDCNKVLYQACFLMYPRCETSESLALFTSCTSIEILGGKDNYCRAASNALF